MDLQPFHNYVKSEKPVLKGIVANHIKDFVAKFNLLLAKSSTEVEDAYIVKEMLPVYAKVRLIKGKFPKVLTTTLNVTHLLIAYQVARTR